MSHDVTRHRNSVGFSASPSLFRSTERRTRALLRRYAPVLLPLILLFGTGFRGLDFGLHWDERPWQIGPVKHMVKEATPLPGYYNYPSFDYWLNFLVLSPDLVTRRDAGETLRQHLLNVLGSHAYLIRLRSVYLAITSLSLVWVYLLVLQRRGNWSEALLASSFFACSWEVEYHLRWVATDGILMQFAALTALLVTHALNTRRDFWLMAAAVSGGLGFATKYPGGLLVLPVILTAFSISSARRERTIRLTKSIALFTLVYLVVTPATVVQPSRFMHAVFYEMKHYAIGHGGHTVGRGFEHSWRMLEYFATVFWSPYLIIAVLIFVLCLIGVANLIARDFRQAATFLVFPVSYLLYFTTQGTMVVRNLLAVVPFLAVAAAQGAQVIAEFVHRRERSAGLVGFGCLRASWAGLLLGCLCLDAFWLVGSADTIAARHSDRFIRQTAEYIRAHSNETFLLSPRIKVDVMMITSHLQNLTDDPAKANAFVLYTSEGMRRWHDWPANRRDLAEAWFGPREVNLNMYPGWWGDDHIVVINHRRADEISLHIAGVSADTAPPADEAQLEESVEQAEPTGRIPPDSLPGSWASNGLATKYLPPIDPRSLASNGEAQTVIYPLVRGPGSGGWELDGSACTFVAREGLVLSISIISTNAFALEQHDPGTSPVPGVGLSAYTTRPGPTGSLRLFARTPKSAVVIRVSGSTPDESPLPMAKDVAVKALAKLDAIGESRMRGGPLHRRSSDR